MAALVLKMSVSLDGGRDTNGKGHTSARWAR
jgi:hypothetical protein